MKGAVLGLSLLLSSILPANAISQTTAEPFGLKFGTSYAEMKKLIPGLKESGQAAIYRSATVPKPYPEFESYSFGITPTVGLCWISGVGKTIEHDPFGSTTRSNFASLRDALAWKYGEPEVADSLEVGSIWKGADDWAMALYKEERVLEANWPRGDDPLGFGLYSIELVVEGLSMSSTYLTLSYWGENFPSCRDELRAGQSDGL